MTHKESEPAVGRQKFVVHILDKRTSHVDSHDGSREEHVLIRVLDMRQLLPLVAGEIMSERRLYAVGLFIKLKDKGIAGRIKLL